MIFLHAMPIILSVHRMLSQIETSAYGFYIRSVVIIQTSQKLGSVVIIQTQAQLEWVVVTCEHSWRSTEVGHSVQLPKITKIY